MKRISQIFFLYVFSAQAKAQLPMPASVNLTEQYSFNSTLELGIKRVILQAAEDTLFYVNFDSLHIRTDLINSTVHFHRNYEKDNSHIEYKEDKKAHKNEVHYYDPRGRIVQSEEVWLEEEVYSCKEFNVSTSEEVYVSLISNDMMLIQTRNDHGELIYSYYENDSVTEYTYPILLEGQKYERFQHYFFDELKIEQVYAKDNTFTYKINCYDNSTSVAWYQVNFPDTPPAYYRSEVRDSLHTTISGRDQRGHFFSTAYLDSYREHKTPTAYGWIVEKFQDDTLLYQQKVFFEDPNNPRTKYLETYYECLSENQILIKRFHFKNNGDPYLEVTVDGDSVRIKTLKRSFYNNGMVKKEVIRAKGERRRVERYKESRENDPLFSFFD